MAWFLTHVLAVSLLVQVLLGFLLLREFLVSGNQACWLMLELGENVPGRKVLESNQGGVYEVYSRKWYDTQYRHHLLVSGYQHGNSLVLFCFRFYELWLTRAFTFGCFSSLHVHCIRILLLFSRTMNVLCMAVNMVLSQMLSSMMISCALALIVMFSLVFEAYIGFLACVSQTFLLSVRQS